MKLHRRIALMLAALVVAVAFVVILAPSATDAQTTPALTPFATPAPYRVTASAGARARSCPNTTRDCPVQTTYQAGTQLGIIGTVAGATVSGSTRWLVLDYRGNRVYIHSSLASPGTAAVATPRPVVSGSSGGGNTGGVSIPNTQPPVSLPQTAGGSCPGLQLTCSQLTCDQARACLAAGGRDLDRDNDGFPCETQCGG